MSAKNDPVNASGAHKRSVNRRVVLGAGLAATLGNGFWGEVTVPTAWQHWQPALLSKRYYDLAYGAVFRIVERSDEADGRAWYRIQDDVYANQAWWVQATHIRRIPESEFAAISP